MSTSYLVLAVGAAVGLFVGAIFDDWLIGAIIGGVAGWLIYKGYDLSLSLEAGADVNGDYNGDGGNGDGNGGNGDE